MKKALVTGISGQDGSYLAKLLLQKGYQVCGTSRDAQISSFRNLDRVGIRGEVELASVALNDFRSVLEVLFKVRPDEIYNLAGQSSVSLSFEQPMETQDSIYLGTLNLLEAVRFTGRGIKLYNASSSECFGDLGGQAATEETAFRPRSPYAVAKSAAFWQVANYRGLTIFLPVRASCLIMNHLCVPNGSLPRRSSGPLAGSPKGSKANFHLATLTSKGTGAGLPTMWKPSI
jgi:GDPmannose 4,6-dehydratase